MGKSCKKTPVAGWCGADSDKEDKQRANRKLRAVVKRKVKEAAVDEEDLILPELREVSEVYDFAKDGKSFVDPEEYPELMRK